MLQNLIKTWKTLKNRKDTRWGVFFALAISESMFFRAHFASNLDAFCIYFACFLTFSRSKVTRGTAKMNAFWCILARHALGCIFCACETGMHDFSCSFCVGFGRGLGQFCMIFDTIPWQSKSGNSSKNANFVIYHDFWCIFSSRKKNSPQWNSLFFWKKPRFRSIFACASHKNFRNYYIPQTTEKSSENERFPVCRCDLGWDRGRVYRAQENGLQTQYIFVYSTIL